MAEPIGTKSSPQSSFQDPNSDRATIPKNAEEKKEVESLEKELADLFGYYKEFMAEKVEVDLSSQWSGSRDYVEDLVAFMLNESNLPLSKLVDEIYDRLNREVHNGTIVVTKRVTYASVRAMVVNEGMRTSFGLPKAGADVWEDTTESCLWCWEAIFSEMLYRLPESVQTHISNRRMCRSRIKDRIAAVSEMMEAKKRLKNAWIKLGTVDMHYWEDDVISDEKYEKLQMEGSTNSREFENELKEEA
ncbi:hypothetical protein VIGAN_04102800 [Vigna angularis var. angularis]|uniref:Uncharacterized protein n=3 Tax=Phaseolus angularis TaxID=3914 RepID=A0A0S3RTA0_PHAAN|nr:hypothetical protein VIGAN_04102800 [Vigna angularis var. angularis]